MMAFFLPKDQYCIHQKHVSQQEMVISDQVRYTWTPFIWEPNASGIARINGVSVF